MKRALALAVFAFLFLYTGFSTKTAAVAQDEAIASRSAEVDGAKLHYMTAGHGTPLILLHGYGSNGDDLISLAPYWADVLPETEFVSPNAPFACEENPFGGFQWFGFRDRSPEMILGGTRAAATRSARNAPAWNEANHGAPP